MFSFNRRPFGGIYPQLDNHGGFNKASAIVDPTKLMFDCILQQKQPKTNLTDRVLQLFEISYGLTLDLDSGIANNGGEPPHSLPKEQSQPFSQNNLTLHRGKTTTNDEFFKLPSPLGVNKESSNGKKLSERGVSSMSVIPAKLIYITPQNQSLIFNFLDYFSQTKNQIDTRLVDMLCKLLRLMMIQSTTNHSADKVTAQAKPPLKIFDFSRGFPDPERARVIFEMRFYHGIERALNNKYLPIRHHSIICEILNSENGGFFDLIMRMIEGKVILKENSPEYLAWGSMIKLCKLFNPRQTEEIINKLRGKYEPSSSIKEGLSRDPNRKSLVRIIRMLLLNTNGIFVQQLRQFNHLQDLQIFCISQINKFLKPRQLLDSRASSNMNLDGSNQYIAPNTMPNASNNQPACTFKSIEPYLSLLFSLLIIHDSMAHQQNAQQQNNAAGTHDHLLAEFLVFFFKTSIDRDQSLLNVEDTSQCLKLLIRAIKDHNLHQRNKDELLEIMEILTLFTGNFQRQNQGLIDLLVNSSGISRMPLLADQSTRISLHAGNGMLQNQSQPSLALMNKNITELGLNEIFESGLLSLIRMESLYDNSFQETSSSLKLLNSLIRFMQSLRKNDDSVVSCISFKLRMIEILVKNYGVNESIKQAVQAITHKLVKSFDNIVQKLVEKEAIMSLMKCLISIGLKDIQREDLTLFLLQEISKLFKKQAFIYLMPDIFLMMSDTTHTLKDNKTNQQLFSTIISVINQHWHDQQFEGITNEGFYTILESLSLCLSKIDMSKGSGGVNNTSSGNYNEPKSYQQFIQMWIVIFSYLTLNKNGDHELLYAKEGDLHPQQKKSLNFQTFLPQLVSLAKLTPYLVYMQEFPLMLRMGSNRGILESFTEEVFQRFPSLSQMPQDLQNAVVVQQKVDDQSKKKKQQAKPQLTVVEIEDDDDESEEIELSFGERLFLAMFAQIQEFRMNSLSSPALRIKLSPTHPNNFVESLLTIFVNDKIDSELFIFKLEKITSALFDIYITDLKSLEQDEQKEEIQIQDYTFLIKSSCHQQRRLRLESLGFLKSFTENFPFLLLKTRVLSTFLDILDALNQEMYTVYDSLSHAIKLASTGEQVFLPTRADSKLDILSQISLYFQDTFLYASLISQGSLNLSFESYKQRLQLALTEKAAGNQQMAASSSTGKGVMATASGVPKHHSQWHDLTGSDLSQSHQQHYGISLFEYLRTNIDLTKIDFISVTGALGSSVPLNFHSLKKLALVKPLIFIKAVDEIKKNLASNSQTIFGPNAQGGFHSVFNVAKKQQQYQIERVINSRAFSTPQSLVPSLPGPSTITIQLSTEVAARLSELQKAHCQPGALQPENSQFHACQALYEELEGKLMKYAMRLDIYYMVKHLLKFHSKENILMLLKRQSEPAAGPQQQFMKSIIEQQTPKGMMSFGYEGGSHQHMKKGMGGQSSMYAALMQTGHLNPGQSTIGNRQNAENCLFQHIPMSIRENHKLGKTLQKLVHQSYRKQYLAKINAKILHTTGLVIALQNKLNQMANFKRVGKSSCNSLFSATSLQSQILLLISSFPAITLCRESITVFKNAFDLCKVYEENSSCSTAHGKQVKKDLPSSRLISILPFTIKVALSKLQDMTTQYSDTSKIKAFELINHLKKEFSDINEESSVLKVLYSLLQKTKDGYDHYSLLENREFLKLQLHSNWKQEQSQKPVIQYLTAIIYLVQEFIHSESLTNNAKDLENLNMILIQVISKKRLIMKFFQVRGFQKLSLMIIKCGFSLIDANKVRLSTSLHAKDKERMCSDLAILQAKVIDFMMHYLRMDIHNSHTESLIDFKEEVQLIRDIRFLIEQHQLEPLSPIHQHVVNIALSTLNSFIKIPVAEFKEHFVLINPNLHQTRRSKKRTIDLANHQLNCSATDLQLTSFLIPSRKFALDLSQIPIIDVEFKTELLFATHLLQNQELTFLAWNFNEKMVDFRSTQVMLEQLPTLDQIKQIIFKYPKFMLAFFTRVGTNPRLLELIHLPLHEDIVMRPHLYQGSSIAFELYLDHLYNNKSLKEFKDVISLWRNWNFVRLCKYLGFKYNGEYFLNQLALKPFEFVKSKTILLYLPEMFQSLRNDSHCQIQRFLINKSKEFASVAHNVLWYCKVEQVPDKSNGRKVSLPLRENLPEMTVILENHIINHMTVEQQQFFDTETEFFERVTSISGLLNPKQSKDEKKAVIREKLIEYNKSIPESVYLPTNSNCKVVGIIPTSGAPMQSAARVPILISFEVEEYPGPDNDPILTQGIVAGQADNRQGEQEMQEIVGFGHRLGKRQGSYSSQIVKRSHRGRSSTQRMKSKSELMKNGEESIVQDDASVQDQLGDEDDLIIGEDSGGDEDEHNVSPHHSPAAQIAVLNVKSRLHQYTFVTNKNEEKFSASVIVQDNHLQSNQHILQHKQHSSSPGKRFNNRHILLEEEKSSQVLVMPNIRNASHTDDVSNFLRQIEDEEEKEESLGHKGTSQPQLRLPSSKAVMKPTVSELELRKTIYKPITDLSQRGGEGYYVKQQTASNQNRYSLANSKKRRSALPKANLGFQALTQLEVQNQPTDSPIKRGQNIRVVSCIFKVNDDLRQDIIALQVIKLFQKIFKKFDLDLFVAPYKCISNRTGEDKTLGGIIECVPNSHSRDQLGKAFEIDLYQYFLKKFGSVHSAEFKLARLNFIKSLSAYSVVSYILQIKDRHNGNIMIDDWGHIIHIDFGFIFDWSPGKDMRFESADFKLTKEFVDIMGGDDKTEEYQLFITKTIQAYLAIREHYAEFRNLIQLMYYSGFPCFKEQSLIKLEERFKLELNVLEAGVHMRRLIENAHEKWTTKLYDRIQYLQNKIVF